MQKFWDSAMAMSPNDDEDETRRLDVLVLILSKILISSTGFTYT
jgi:hypothetical protein